MSCPCCHDLLMYCGFLRVFPSDIDWLSSTICSLPSIVSFVVDIKKTCLLLLILVRWGYFRIFRIYFLLSSMVSIWYESDKLVSCYRNSYLGNGYFFIVFWNPPFFLLFFLSYLFYFFVGIWVSKFWNEWSHLQK